MENVKITLLSREPHVSQILTGFMMLERRGMVKIDVEDRSQDETLPYRSVMLEVFYRGKKLIYDMLDGYQHKDAIRYQLAHCDYYFKRSFSKEKNEALGLKWEGKMFPLGFNYHVSCIGHPVDRPYWKEKIKEMLEKCVREISGYSKCMHVNSFEKGPDYKTKDLKIMFMSRLWNPQEIELNEQTPAQWRPYKEYMIEERNKINRERVQIVRQLREIYGASFLGGIQDSTFARNYAPDVLVPLALTRKGRYLHEMQRADICVGSMGLHKSIGWKTGEYVAASRAIVAERFYYQLPGGFEAGKNYLPFDTAEECLENVELLYKAPEAVYNMKVENHKYYCNWLRPEAQILRALEQVY